MIANNYWKKNYRCSILDGNDNLSLKKSDGSEWADIEMETNGFDNGKITIRSKEAAEHLKFMLNQMLDTSGV